MNVINRETHSGKNYFKEDENNAKKVTIQPLPNSRRESMFIVREHDFFRKSRRDLMFFARFLH
jgi:hypothetical protein